MMARRVTRSPLAPTDHPVRGMPRARAAPRVASTRASRAPAELSPRRNDHVDTAPRDPASRRVRARSRRLRARRGARCPGPRVRQPLPARARPRQPAARARHARRRRDAADRRGARARRDPHAQPGDLRDDVDGAGGPAGHRREPPPQLHRPRRVPADGGDRAALHPHARRPVPRAGRDDRRAHAGLVRGDHARRALAEVEVARAARGGRQGHRRGPTSSSAGTCTSCGRSSAATSTSSRASSRCSPTSTRSGPRTSSPTSTRTRSGSPRSSGTTFTGHADDIVGINDLLVRLRDEQGLDVPLHVDAGQRRVRVAVPLPALRVGLPARAGPLDQRLRPQVRARVPGDRLAHLP